MSGIWIAVGGGLGSLARFGISGWVTTWAYAGFPWGTFAVNVLGCLLLGLFTRILLAPGVSAPTRGFLMAGFCGGFTTFSTFDFENLSLLQQGQYATASLYMMATAACCIGGILAGRAAGERWMAE